MATHKSPKGSLGAERFHEFDCDLAAQMSFAYSRGPWTDLWTRASEAWGSHSRVAPRRDASKTGTAVPFSGQWRTDLPFCVRVPVQAILLTPASPRQRALRPRLLTRSARTVACWSESPRADRQWLMARRIAVSPPPRADGRRHAPRDGLVARAAEADVRGQAALRRKVCRAQSSWVNFARR